MPIVYVHSYDEKTKEYIHNSEPAQIDPLQPDNLLVPAHATTIEPPQVSANEVSVFDEINEEWLVKADHRGEVYYDTTTQEKITISEIGVTPDEAWTTAEPTDPAQIWNGTAWEVPFTILVERKKAEIASARYESATGTVTIDEYTYNIDKDSQTAFLGKQSAFATGLLTQTEWKTEDGFVTLTAVEFARIGIIVQAYIDACFLAEKAILERIVTVTTPAKLAAIKWEAPDAEDIITALAV